MVQVIDDPYSGNVFGRIGKGVGQGLSEQIPKEIERSRLSSGLKKFEKESAGLTPVQQFTRLAGIPGITPEHLYTLAPLLKQQAQREEGSNLGGRGVGGAASAGQNYQPGRGGSNPEQALGEENTPYSQEAKEAGMKRSLKGLEATTSQLTPIVKKSPEELFSEASLLSQQNPYTYPTPRDAMPFVQENENTRVQNLEEERSVANTADKIQQQLRARLIATVGGEDTAKGIPGTVQTRLLRNIEDDLANPKNKLSEQQIIDKWASVGKRVAEAQTNLDAKSKGGWLSSLGAIGGPVGLVASTINAEYLPKKIRDTIEATRKVYHEAEADEEFQNLIAAKFDLTSAGSAYLTYPRENPSINKYVEGINSSKANTNPERLAIDAADFVSRNINSTDSILSYAMELKKKGVNPQAFFDRMNQNGQSGLFTPNGRQQNEFQKGYPLVPTLGDMYIFSLQKQNKLAQP